MNLKRLTAAVAAVLMAAGTICCFSEVPETKVSAADDYYFHYDMESDTASFEGRGSVTVSASSDGYSESRALECSDRTAEWNGIQIPLDDTVIKPGEEYSISALFKGKEDAEFKITLQYGTGDDMDYDKVAAASTASGTWIMLSNTNYKVPSGADNMYLVFETTDSTCDFTLDEVVIAKAGTKTDGPKGVKIVQQSDVRGDLDGDERITVADLSILKNGIVNGWRTTAEKKNADIDKDRKIDAKDPLYLQQYLLGEIAEFPDNYVGPIISDEEKAKCEALFKPVTPDTSWKKDNENNPCTTQRFGADPGWLVYDGRLYLYTTNDAFEYRPNGNMQENTYNSGTINCISSADMVNWTDHGALPIAGQNGRTKGGVCSWAGAAWAPDACCKTFEDGSTKFYLFFANSGGGIGVVMSDSPTGPWKDAAGGALLTHNSPNCSDVEWMFDPGVYYDETKDECYVFFGGGRKTGIPAESPGTGRVVKVYLLKDKVTLAGNPVKNDIPYLFEDSSVIKIGNTWYYSYCANWDVPYGGATVNGVKFDSADILYMKSDDPLSWKTSNLAGNVFRNTGSQGIDAGGNNHHSIIYFKDKYYVAYHSRQQALRMQAANGYKFYNTKDELLSSKDGNYRSTQINEATFSNGTITCKGDMKGVGPVETLDPFKNVEAETMNNQSVGINVRGTGNTVVTDIKKGDWIKVAYADFKKAPSVITANVGSKNGGYIKVCTKLDGEAVAYIEVPAGDIQEAEAVVFGELSGTTDLYFIFSEDGIEFDSWQFS